MRIIRGASSFDPLQIGNHYSQVDILNGTIPVSEGGVIRLIIFNGGTLKIYASRDNGWLKDVV